MGKLVWRDAVIKVAGTDLSDHANDVTVEDTADETEFTGFGPSGYKEFGQGLKDATITATFYQDFAGSSVHQTLQGLYASGSTFEIAISPMSGSITATNPAAKMTARLYSYGFGGAVGDALTVQATFRNGGTGGVTWATAGTI